MNRALFRKVIFGCAAVLAVTSAPAHAGRWLVVDDFNQGRSTGTVPDRAGVSFERGRMILKPGTSNFRPGTDVKAVFARRASRVRMSVITRGCNDAESASIEMKAAMGIVRSDGAYRVATVELSKGGFFSAEDYAKVYATVYDWSRDFSELTSQAYGAPGIDQQDGARVSLEMRYSPNSFYALGNRFDSMGFAIKNASARVVPARNRYIEIFAYADDPQGNCQFEVDKIEVYVP